MASLGRTVGSCPPPQADKIRHCYKSVCLMYLNCTLIMLKRALRTKSRKRCEQGDCKHFLHVGFELLEALPSDPQRDSDGDSSPQTPALTHVVTF